MDANDLARRYGPLVRRLATRTCPRVGVLDADDLAQEGFLALPGAAAAFDPGRGVALETYLAFRLRGAMLDALRRADHLRRGQRARVSAGLEPPVLVGNLEEPLDPDEPGGGRLVDLLPQGREPDPAAAPDARDLAEWLGRGLVGRRGEFFRLHCLGGLPQGRAAALMGLSDSRGSQLAGDVLEHCRLRAALLLEREGRAMDTKTAVMLRNLLRDDGASLTYEQALMHLGEDGLACTRAEYEAAWENLHGGEDAKGRRRRPPGAAAPPAQPPEPARPAESEGPVSESNGVHAAPLNRFEVAAKVREITRACGQDASNAEIKAAALKEGLTVSDAQAWKAFGDVFPGVTRRGGVRKGVAGGPRPAPAPRPRPAPRHAPRPAAAAPAPVAPAPAGGEDLLGQVLEARRLLAGLKQRAEAAGGQLRYTFEFTLREEG